VAVGSGTAVSIGKGSSVAVASAAVVGGTACTELVEVAVAVSSGSLASQALNKSTEANKRTTPLRPAIKRKKVIITPLDRFKTRP
jgi:hypothetical protein